MYVTYLNSQTTNGWSTYETWLAYSWLTSDEVGQKLLRKAKRQPGGFIKQSEWLCEQFVEPLYDLLCIDKIFGEDSLYKDLMEHAIYDVKWDEIIVA
jgi:hypothetical protein